MIAWEQKHWQPRSLYYIEGMPDDGRPPGHTEGSNTTPWHWLMLVVHTVIAISLVVLVVLSVHNSLSLRATLSDEDASQSSCEQPGFRS